MGKGEERAHGAPEQHDDTTSSPPQTRCIFEEPATLREPAAPQVPRVMPPSAVAVIPLPGETSRATSPHTTLQEAREATDALLHEIFEEEFEEELDAPADARPAREEDWPQELHSLPLTETAKD